MLWGLGFSYLAKNTCPSGAGEYIQFKVFVNAKPAELLSGFSSTCTSGLRSSVLLNSASGHTARVNKYDYDTSETWECAPQILSCNLFV